MPSVSAAFDSLRRGAKTPPLKGWEPQGELRRLVSHLRDTAPKRMRLEEETAMSTILIIILIILLIGGLPTWPYSSGWGYYPSGGVGLILLIIIILALMGRL